MSYKSDRSAILHNAVIPAERKQYDDCRVAAFIASCIYLLI